MTSKRFIVLIAVLVLVVAVAAASWYAGTQIESPAEAAARTAPPTPSPILTPIEERVLTTEIITRGTSRFERPRTLNLVPSNLKGSPGIVTTTEPDGTVIESGNVMMTASQRPVFVLEGEIPVYRDLVPGISGADVRQLETALAGLGLDPGEIDGRFDQQTAKAVEDLYRRGGFEPFGPVPDVVAEIDQLKAKLAEAVGRADDLKAERAMASLDRQVAQATLEAEQHQRAAETHARREALEQVRTDTTLSDDARDRASAELAAAEAFARAAELSGQQNLTRIDTADAALERQLEAVLDAVADLERTIAAAGNKMGTAVPSDEIVFVTGLPIRIDRFDVEPGRPAIGAVVQVTGQRLEIDGSLGLSDAPLIAAGMPVEIDEPELGIKAHGVVKRVAAKPGTDGADGYHVYFETSVDDTDVELAGVSLRLTIPVRSSGEAVAAVPVTALSLGANGEYRVELVRDGKHDLVTVEPGLTAGGYVEISGVDRELAPGEMVVVGYE